MYAIEINNFSWKYLGSENWTLKDINLQIKKGEFIGVIGPSGAGKTTLTLCMNGLIPQRIAGVLKGEVKILGKSVTKTDIYELSRHVGIVFQDPETQFVSMRVRNEIAFGMENYGLPRAVMEERLQRVAEMLKISNLLDKTPTELSGGQKQRVAIASILVMNPDIFIFDEPVSDLDPLGKEEVYQAIAKVREESDATIVVIDHEIEELSKSADRIILMNEGRILLDLPPHEFVEYAETVEAVGETIPAISKLFYQMKKSGRWRSKIPITVEEAIKLVNNDDLKNAFAAHLRRSEKKYGYGEKLGEEIITVKNLTHIYPDDTVAITDVNLSVRRGEFLAIIGSNGSGKTTLAKHLNGLLKPTKGFLKVCGIDIPGPRVGELSKHVGYVFQNPDHQLFCNTVWDELLFSPLKMGMPREAAEKEALKVMDWLGLTPWRDEQPFFLGKGQRRRLAVGSVLTVKPEVLVVDEPTTGQDWKGSVEMMNLLTQLNRELGITVLIITHNMRLVSEYSERVIAMNAGRIIYDGSVRDLFLNDEILRQTAIKPPQLVSFFKHLFKNHDVPITFKEIEDFQPISKL